MKICSVFLCLLIILSFTVVLRGSDTLDLYVLDVEGAKAVIIQNPSGQALLIDGGMPGNNDRDLKRVAAAAQALGIKQFDVILVTHYDVDHVGNIPAIFAQFPAKLLVDHGPLLPNPVVLNPVNRKAGNAYVEQAEPGMSPMNRKAADAYLAFVPGKKRLSVKPGDTIPFKDVKITVLTSNEQTITKPFTGAGKPNAACPATLPEPIRYNDNAACVGTLWQFGKFRMAEFGDLLQWMEMRLMCPNNPVGTVDLLMASAHGLAVSNSRPLVHALAPKVVVSGNGERKGIDPEVVKVLRSSPGIQDIWQAHYSTTAGPDNNAPEQFIANMTQRDCQGFSIKVSARRDGSFTVTNLRNNFSKTYKP